jgi:hypothetical protein
VDSEGKRVSAEAVHRAHLASLRGEFCAVVTTEEALML